MEEPLSWHERARRRVRRCGIFDLYHCEREAADGRSAGFYVLEAPTWVNVVPVLSEGSGGERLVMVRQFRQGIAAPTVEFPAGLVEAGEDPREAAARELAEETGYRARSLQPIGRVAANPAFMTNWCLTFCAEGLAAGTRRLDALEDLEVLEVPAERLRASIGQGEFINSMTAVALLWYLRYREIL